MLRRAARALGGLHLERAAAGGSQACQAASEHSAPDAAPASQPSCSRPACASYSTGAAASRGVAFRNNPYKNNPAYVPWTPSKDLIKRKTYQKRMRHLVQALEQEQVQQALAHKKVPDFRAGDILELRMLVPENQRKEYVFRGLCIARYNKGVRTSFKVYNVFPEVGGFVQHFPLYMPDLLEVRVVGHIKAQRAKLYNVLEREDSTFTYQQEVKPVA